ncbi:hypothetical protein D9M71_218180 [compost metagenome]
MLIGRVLGRAPLTGGKGTELPGQRDQLAVKGLRMQGAEPGQVGDQRFGTIDQLQQQEVGDFRGAAGARGHHPPGQRLAALVQQALQLVAKAGQTGRGGHIQQRRNPGFVQLQCAVGALLHHAHHTHAGVFTQAVPFGQQAQGASPHSHRRAALEWRIVVTHFADLAEVAGAAQRLTLVRRIAGAGALERQRQVDQAVAQAVVDRQRRGRRVVAGNVERRTVGQHAAGGKDRQPALAQQRVVDAQLGKAPAAGDQAAATAVDQGFEETVVLLEVLGPEKHSLGPHHSVIPGHGWAPDWAISLARARQSRRAPRG